MRKTALGFAAALLLLGGLAWMAWPAYRSHELSAEGESSANARFSATADNFKRDQKRGVELLEGLELPHGMGDAGLFLNLRLPWNGTNPAGTELHFAPRTAPNLSLPDRIVEHYQGKDWASKLSPEMTSGDTRWMAHLQRYDRWDWGKGSVLAVWTGQDYFDMPLPDLLLLRTWAKMRLAQGLLEHTFLQALRDVRHLARLCLHTEDVRTMAVAISILRYETTAVDAALKLEPSVETELRKQWTVVPEQDRALLQRTLYGAQAYFRINTPRTGRLKPSEVSLGFCAALGSGVKEAVLLAPYLEEHRAERYAYLEKILEGSRDRCQLSMTRKLWKQHRKFEEAFRIGQRAEVEQERATGSVIDVVELRQELCEELAEVGSASFRSDNTGSNTAAQTCKKIVARSMWGFGTSSFYGESLLHRLPADRFLMFYDQGL